MIESMLVAVFVLGLPVWLVVEQVVATTCSAEPAHRPAAKRAVPSVAYQSR